MTDEEFSLLEKKLRSSDRALGIIARHYYDLKSLLNMDSNRFVKVDKVALAKRISIIEKRFLAASNRLNVLNKQYNDALDTYDYLIDDCAGELEE